MMIHLFKLYAEKIKKNEMTIDNVPEIWRSEVEKLINGDV